MAIIELMNCFLMLIAWWIKFRNESLKSTEINTKNLIWYSIASGVIVKRDRPRHAGSFRWAFSPFLISWRELCWYWRCEKDDNDYETLNVPAMCVVKFIGSIEKSRSRVFFSWMKNYFFSFIFCLSQYFFLYLLIFNTLVCCIVNIFFWHFTLSSFCQTHRTFMEFSSLSRSFNFGVVLDKSGVELNLRWLMTFRFFNFSLILSFLLSSPDDEFVDIMVELSGRPTSWNEFMLENPLSSSVWWHDEKILLALFWFLNEIFGWTRSSSSLFEEFDDECTEDSSVLRIEICDSWSKSNIISLLLCFKLTVDVFTLVEIVCDRIGSWVLRKLWTVRESR